MSNDKFYYISTRREDMQPEAIKELLSQSYWAQDRELSVIEGSIENSKCYGAFLKDTGKQVGFARVFTDYYTVYCICDVIVHEDYRNRGIGTALVETISADPELQDLRGILSTLHAHKLYEKFGFSESESVFMMKKSRNGH